MLKTQKPETIFSLRKGFPGYNWAMESLRENFVFLQALREEALKQY